MIRRVKSGVVQPLSDQRDSRFILSIKEPQLLKNEAVRREPQLKKKEAEKHPALPGGGEPQLQKKRGRLTTLCVNNEAENEGLTSEKEAYYFLWRKKQDEN